MHRSNGAGRDDRVQPEWHHHLVTPHGRVQASRVVTSLPLRAPPDTDGEMHLRLLLLTLTTVAYRTSPWHPKSHQVPFILPSCLSPNSAPGGAAPSGKR